MTSERILQDIKGLQDVVLDVVQDVKRLRSEYESTDELLRSHHEYIDKLYKRMDLIRDVTTNIIGEHKVLMSIVEVFVSRIERLEKKI